MNTTWLADIEKKKYPKLDTDIQTEVVVIGAGMAGSITAYLLAKEGKKVVLIDKGGIEHAMTAYTTAWITTDLDTDLSDLVKMYGKKKEKDIWDSGNNAIDLYEKIINEEKIECEFTRASVFGYTGQEKEIKTLEEEYQTAQDLGIQMNFSKELYFGFNNLASIEIPNQAKFHPLKFLNGIQQAAMTHGVQIYHQTEATDIEELEGDKGVTVILKSGNKITAEYSITATYQPFKNPKELFAKKGMYVSYVFELSLPKGTIKEGMYLDTHNPYHYFRIDPKDDHDRMILGGEDHREEIPFMEEKSFTALEDFVKKLLPNVPYKIVKKWSGKILENVDGLPHMGNFSKKKERQLIMTAFSGNGMHFSMIAGGVCRDIILGRKNTDIALYDAKRKLKLYNFMKKVIDFGGEFIGGVVKNLFK